VYLSRYQKPQEALDEARAEMLRSFLVFSDRYIGFMNMFSETGRLDDRIGALDPPSPQRLRRGLPLTAAFSLSGILSETTPTCRIRREADGAEREFTGANVADGKVGRWLAGSDGRVITLFDQTGNGRHALAVRGALYAEHPERGVCLRFTGEPDQVYGATIDNAGTNPQATLLHYSRFDSAGEAGSATLAGCWAGGGGGTVGRCIWRLGENRPDGRVFTDIGDSRTLSDKPNGWWRTPMLYVSLLGPAVAHWIGDYAFDRHAGAALAGTPAQRLCIGGAMDDSDSLFSGELFDLVMLAGSLDDADRKTAVASACRRRMRPFPFQECVSHVGEAFRHPATRGVAGANHPAVIKEDDTYYLFWNTDTGGGNFGIHLATSPDMRNWTQRGRMLGPGPDGRFDDQIPFAPRLKKIRDTWVMWFAAQRRPDGRSSIGLAGNQGDLANPADWIRHGQILDAGFAGRTITIDPVVYYAPNGYDPGNGDGEHPIWMLYGSGVGNSEIYDLYLVYADDCAGPYRSANGGRPVSSVDGKGYPYLWPGDIWRDPQTGAFWKLQSYGVTVRAGYANGRGRAGWTYADSLVGPWYWVPRHMAYLAPERTGDQRAIEVSFFGERDDLHIFSANDSDDVGYRDSVQHWRSRVSAAPGCRGITPKIE
jgi:hypothetical protein